MNKSMAAISVWVSRTPSSIIIKFKIFGSQLSKKTISFGSVVVVMKESYLLGLAES